MIILVYSFINVLKQLPGDSTILPKLNSIHPLNLESFIKEILNDCCFSKKSHIYSMY